MAGHVARMEKMISSYNLFGKLQAKRLHARPEHGRKQLKWVQRSSYMILTVLSLFRIKS
jgi:hypothetical protein